MTEGMGGGLMALEIQTGGGSEPKNTSSGLLSILLMFQLLQSISFQKLLCIFRFYYSFKLQTCNLIYFESYNQSVGSPLLLLWKVSNVQ